MRITSRRQKLGLCYSGWKVRTGQVYMRPALGEDEDEDVAGYQGLRNVGGTSLERVNKGKYSSRLKIE